jgi:hypothetical protein
VALLFSARDWKCHALILNQSFEYLRIQCEIDHLVIDLSSVFILADYLRYQHLDPGTRTIMELEGEKQQILNTFLSRIY